MRYALRARAIYSSKFVVARLLLERIFLFVPRNILSGGLLVPRSLFAFLNLHFGRNTKFTVQNPPTPQGAFCKDQEKKKVKQKTKKSQTK